MSGKQHWEKVYMTKSSQHVSWYQQHASLSLQLIQSAVSATDACIIDVGGGASTLVDDCRSQAIVISPFSTSRVKRSRLLKKG